MKRRFVIRDNSVYCDNVLTEEQAEKILKYAGVNWETKLYLEHYIHWRMGNFAIASLKLRSNTLAYIIPQVFYI